MGEPEYQKQTVTTKKYPRPFGHVLRSTVLLTAIWMYFLFAVCVPYGKQAEDVSGKWKTHFQMIAAGAGFVQGIAFILMIFAFVGIRRTSTSRMVALVLLVLYVLGGILHAAGRGTLTKDWWPDASSSLRTQLVGVLIGEVGFVAAGLLVLLPDFGILNDWEGK